MPAQQLSFYTEDIRLCTTLGIINDITVHGDREALLNVEAVDSQFMVTSDTATIRFIDEQGVYISKTLAFPLHHDHLYFSLVVRNITVDLTADPDRVPAEAPYNTFQLTCSAEEIASQDSLTFQIQWMRETGPDEVETVTEDSHTIIEISDTDPEGVLTATRTEPGQYVFYCNVVYLYDGEVIISAT